MTERKHDGNFIEDRDIHGERDVCGVQLRG